MKYVAKPVVVEAFEITGIARNEHGQWTIEMRRDGGVFVKQLLDGETARYVPAIGDFYVIQEDGYGYINPRGVFLRKYREQDAEKNWTAQALSGDRPTVSAEVAGQFDPRSTHAIKAAAGIQRRD